MTTTTTKEYVTIDGLKLSVKIAGTGRPFLFLHGLCGDRWSYSRMMPDGNATLWRVADMADRTSVI